MEWEYWRNRPRTRSTPYTHFSKLQSSGISSILKLLFYLISLVVFDPASFYGHSEFDLAIAGIFGGFNSQFYNSYFEVIPKEPGYEGRQLLYQLFHYLNHWFVLPMVNQIITTIKRYHVETLK